MKAYVGSYFGTLIVLENFFEVYVKHARKRRRWSVIEGEEIKPLCKLG